MPSKSFKLAGVELAVTVNRRALSITGAISNRWPVALYERLRGGARGQSSSGSAPDGHGEPPIPAGASPQQRALLERIRGIVWYHSIDLGHSVVTPGFFDHRPILDKYQLPERLDGLRVLDVATFDGFWAFEFEKRGASEVVALDLDRFGEVDLAPRVRAGKTPEELAAKVGKGFAVVHDVLGSKVRREVISLYDLSPGRLGKFDVVHSGDVLLHLMNPMKALQAICSVTGGYALISDCYFPGLDQMAWDGVVQYCGGRTDCIWWKFSFDALEQMIHDAGFGKVELVSKFKYGTRGNAPTLHHAVFKAYPERERNSQPKP